MKLGTMYGMDCMNAKAKEFLSIIGMLYGIADELGVDIEELFERETYIYESSEGEIHVSVSTV